MAALLEAAPESQSVARQFSVLAQKLDLEIDFLHQAVKGSTELTIIPLSKDLRQIHLHCRQSDIKSITVEGKKAAYEYRDPYRRVKPYPSWTVNQAHLLRDRFDAQFPTSADASREQQEENSISEPQEELIIKFPRNISVQEFGPYSAIAQDGFFGRTSKGAGNQSAIPETPTVSAAAELQASYLPLKVTIHFEVHRFRDGLHFVGLSEGDARYPHAYTQTSIFPGAACSLFPCIDDAKVRNSWEISIKCPRTLGDALNAPPRTGGVAENGQKLQRTDLEAVSDLGLGLSERERALEMTVVCSGDLTDETIPSKEPNKKILSFSCQAMVSANQIGFAVGPFEHVDLSDLREVDEDDKLGEEAVRVQAFCLPGRVDEVRNTAMPMAKAVDFFTTTFTTYPFSSYTMCFVDDLPSDTVVTTAVSFCSTRLLFPADIIDPIYDVTRKLVHALASQYAGISVAPRTAKDTWCVVGMAYFMTDLFMKHLCGNNEYRYRQKLAADRVYELDIGRHTLYDLGALLSVDPFEVEFMALKASVVLFVLDRRLTKSSGSAGMTRIISRTVLNAKASDSDATLLSTAQFQQRCERIGHMKLDTFFGQWVHSAGCPHFRVTQRFNKKKLVVEMQVQQMQNDPVNQRSLPDVTPKTFMRDVNEELAVTYAGDPQPVFKGPMTIRIHEADGTPYEHIVEIKDSNMKFEIPYNTKYKRLKRSRRQKERAVANAGQNASNEAQDDVLFYCLGDVLQSEEEVSDWRLVDWGKEEEDKMGEESYEWIRMDADFEWICKMEIKMPAYMYISQLQQDRDIVAQYETMQWLATQKGHPLISTFLTRTVMDRRYFHGIRTVAAAILPRCATDELAWVGFFHLDKIFSELFCVSDSVMTRSNDFSDRTSYLVQCAIPKAISRIRNNSGLVPMHAKRFFIDKLKFNDNTSNEFSDCYYIATLMSCLADTLTVSNEHARIVLGELDQAEEDDFKKDAISEIERYRRIDEWISSYHNVFSTTALDCLLRLAESKILDPKLADFLQYTRLGNAHDVRAQAFRCLVRLGGLKNGAILKYLLYSLSHDQSPYMRQQIWNVFGEGLGIIAVGDDLSDVVPQSTNEGLIIEQDGSTEARQTSLARRRSAEGAMAALKAEIGSNDAFKDGLFAAATADVPSLVEIRQLLTLCTAFFEMKDTLVLNLKYPRYWSCKNEGDGRVVFTADGRIRTKAQKPLQATAPAQSKPPPPSRAPTIKVGKLHMPAPLERKPTLSLSLGKGVVQSPSAQTHVRTTPAGSVFITTAPPPAQSPAPRQVLAKPERRTPSPARSSPASQRKSLIVKLKVSGLANGTSARNWASMGPPPHSNGHSSSRRASSDSADIPLRLTSDGRGGRHGSINLSSPDTVLKREPFSPPPLEYGAVQSGRRSSAASASTAASRSTPGPRGKKRNSGTPSGNAKAKRSRNSTTPSSARATPGPATNGHVDPLKISKKPSLIVRLRVGRARGISAAGGIGNNSVNSPAKAVDIEQVSAGGSSTNIKAEDSSPSVINPPKVDDSYGPVDVVQQTEVGVDTSAKVRDDAA